MKLLELTGIHRYGITCCSFNPQPGPEGDTLCLGANDTGASLLHVAQVDLVQKLAIEHAHKLRGCCFSPDGARLCLASLDKTASFWDTRTGSRSFKQLQSKINTTHGTHDEYIRCCSFSQDGRLLVLGSGDETASLWHMTVSVRLNGGNLPSGLALVGTTASSYDSRSKSGEGQDSAPTRVERFTIGRNGNRLDRSMVLTHLIEGKESGEVRHSVIDLTPSRVEKLIEQKKLAPLTLEFALNKPELRATLNKHGQHKARIGCCCFAPDSKTLCLGLADSVALIYDLTQPEPEQLCEIRQHSQPIRCCAFSRDGQLLCLGSQDKTASLINWQLAQHNDGPGVVVHGFKRTEGGWQGHTKAVVCCSFSSSGKLLILGSEDKTASLWNVETPGGISQPIRTLTCGDKVVCCCFSPTLELEDMLCLGSQDGNASVYFKVTDTNQEPKIIEGVHHEGIASCDFSPDGDWLCLASDDRQASLIHMTTPRALVNPLEWPHWMMVPSVSRVVAPLDTIQDCSAQQVQGRGNSEACGSPSPRARTMSYSNLSISQKRKLADQDAHKVAQLKEFAWVMAQGCERYPEIMWSDQGELLRRCVDSGSAHAVKCLVDAALNSSKMDAPPIIAMLPYEYEYELVDPVSKLKTTKHKTKFSVLRRAALHKDRLMIEKLLKLHGEALKQNERHGYYCAVISKRRPGPCIHANLSTLLA